ncbi:MAG: TIGR02757 family protein [Lewinellaceae bacterium]|nr:TIGR02757 family protein [Lewinellaceae bacterium]
MSRFFLLRKAAIFAKKPEFLTIAPAQLKSFLDDAVRRFNTPDFISGDPISIPHGLARPQDREIMGFWTATLAWGQRKTIIQNARRLTDLMDGAPYEFIVGHEEKDRRRFLEFKHRTFQATDTLWFLEFFQQYYRNHDTLETAFAQHLGPDDATTEHALTGFHRFFFDHPYAPERTRKHVATPERGSTCKRINMFLRWMVRHDASGVDFGMWKRIRPAQLLIPLDVHVERVARRLGLLNRRQADWKAVLELTENLRAFDPDDPVKYDFALFGLGVLENKDFFGP